MQRIMNGSAQICTKDEKETLPRSIYVNQCHKLEVMKP